MARTRNDVTYLLWRNGRLAAKWMGFQRMLPKRNDPKQKVHKYPHLYEEESCYIVNYASFVVLETRTASRNDLIGL